MDADTGQTHAFSLLHDKNMLAPASAASWCPTMDLLALATSDGQLRYERVPALALGRGVTTVPIARDLLQPITRAGKYGEVCVCHQLWVRARA